MSEPSDAVLPLNVISLFSALIVISCVVYIAPPLPPAVLSVKLASVMVIFSVSLYTAPPFSDAVFFVKLTFSIIIAPS